MRLARVGARAIFTLPAPNTEGFYHTLSVGLDYKHLEQDILLGSEAARWGWIQSKRCRELARTALSHVGRDIPLDALVVIHRVGSLAPGDQIVLVLATSRATVAIGQASA